MKKAKPMIEEKYAFKKISHYLMEHVDTDSFCVLLEELHSGIETEENEEEVSNSIEHFIEETYSRLRKAFTDKEE